MQLVLAWLRETQITQRDRSATEDDGMIMVVCNQTRKERKCVHEVEREGQRETVNREGREQTE